MQQEIRIVDLGEAAVLMTMGFALLRLEQSKRGNHKIFLFEKVTSNEVGTEMIADGIVQDYKARKLLLDPYEFFLNQKELKSKIHQMEDQTP